MNVPERACPSLWGTCPGAPSLGRLVRVCPVEALADLSSRLPRLPSYRDRTREQLPCALPGLQHFTPVFQSSGAHVWERTASTAPATRTGRARTLMCALAGGEWPHGGPCCWFHASRGPRLPCLCVTAFLQELFRGLGGDRPSRFTWCPSEVKVGAGVTGTRSPCRPAVSVYASPSLKWVFSAHLLGLKNCRSFGS